MKTTVVIPNSIIHVLLYGYFEHGYEIWYAMQKNIGDYSYQDLAAQKYTFAAIRSRLRGFENHSAPNAITGIALVLGAGKSYPKEIVMQPGEYHFFKQIIQLKFKDLQRFLKKYCKITKSSMPEDPHSELINSLRTPEAVDFLMKKFKSGNQY